MAKKIFFWSLIALFITGISGGYFYLSNSKKPKHDTLLNLPDSCFLVIEIKNYVDFIKKTTQTNLMWEELKKQNIHFFVPQIMMATDSLLNDNKESDSYIHDNKISIALYGKPDNPSLIYAFAMKKGFDERWIVLLNNKGFKVKKEIGKKSSLPFYVVEKTENNTKFYAYVKEDEVLASQEINLLEACLFSRSQLGMNAEFMKCREASGNKNDLRMYCNRYTSDYLVKKEIADSYGSPWMEVDIDIRPNELLFNGIIGTDSSDFLREIAKQNPCEIEFPEFCPQETKSFTFWGFSDFNAFYSAQVQSQDNYQSAKIYSDLVKNTGEELIHLQIEFEKGETSDFVQIKMNDRTTGEKIIRELSDSSFAMSQEEDTDSLYRITDTAAAGKATAGLFHQKTKYAFFVDDYLILACEKNTCTKFHEKVKNGVVLSDNENFRRFYSGNISEECNFLRYDYLPQTYTPNYLEKKIKNKIDGFPELFRKFHSSGVQLIAGKNQLIMQGYLLYSPTSNESRQSVWETRLDTGLATQPELVVNHNTGLSEIFAQDISGNIYLISSTGNIIWKKNISGVKKGKVFQVDYFQNNKLQFLFNTKNQIHLIDRNGKDVEGFPLTLKFPATNSINVFDYDNNKDYRIIYCDSLKKINLIKINGKNVDGFQSSVTLNGVSKPAEWHRVASKDYLLLTDTTGYLYAMSRKGETRMKFKDPLPMNKQDLHILKGKDASRSAIVIYNTSKKEIQKYCFDESRSITPIKTSLNNPNWQLVNANEENKFFLILTEKNAIEIYDEDGNLLNSLITETPLVSSWKKITKNKEIYFAGITQSNSLLLINSNWKSESSEMIRSSWLPCLEMLNDDGLFYWITGHKNLISCYSF